MTLKHAVLTMADDSRQAHVDMQLAGLNRWAPDTPHYRARLGKDRNLAKARNSAAQMALEEGKELLIFLDADCIPGPDLVSGYLEAAAHHPGEVLCGPVTYLGPPPEGGYQLGELEKLTNPHAARPNPAPGTTQPGSDEEWNLFWSLSFAMDADTWKTSGGFDEGYVGYGGEDTDFAYKLRAQHRRLRWVGGTHAYHQWHPVSSPPVEHLDDILVNAARFHSHWGTWPMQGWLDAFARDGLIEFRDGAWVRG